MILLNKEQIKYLHSKMIQETGGSNGIRDEGLLDSALSVPFQSFGGMELYPSMIGKAARLCCGLIKNHAFFDGNKRIGIYAMLVFLELNGMEMECSEEELIALGLGIASGKIEEKDIGIWIVKHNRGE